MSYLVDVLIGLCIAELTFVSQDARPIGVKRSTFFHAVSERVSLRRTMTRCCLGSLVKFGLSYFTRYDVHCVQAVSVSTE
jgi:hypothetical protein